MNKISLESRLKAEVVSFSGKVCLYANDFKGNIIEINADEKFEAGSCCNVFILAELFKQVEEKRINLADILEYTKKHYVIGSGILRSMDFGVKLTVKNFATLMIIISDNIATNILIDLLGINNINNTCNDLGFSNTVLHNKIDFDKYEGFATTTPKDYGKIFGKICKKELWSKESSEQMLEILKNQYYNTILTRNLPQYYLDSEDTGDEELIYIASKSGNMDTCRNDGGIIHTPYGNYVISIFTKLFKDPLYYGDHESYRYGPKASRLLFDQYLALKGRFK